MQTLGKYPQAVGDGITLFVSMLFLYMGALFMTEKYIHKKSEDTSLSVALF